MLYTRMGDDGTTRDFGSKTKKRISKSSNQMESLGALDELNSFLGLVKVKSKGINFSFKKDIFLEKIILGIQNNLFIIQAEVAGADKTIEKIKILEMEELIDDLEKKLPPIKSFFISGGTELATLLDISRTLARKVERRIVGILEKKEIKVGNYTLAFMNRLSSLLYVLARLINHESDIKEVPPDY